ncbi:hypothetical protein T4B_9445 [Trichinella pseudospiralis]|uniref:Uncharacterized protein n=1 Tax=Trichinella pseudospiralis TaxID=6337 RepID=A0A0V1GDA7_TRIPS|nr:hypothetical protein T4B_9445 [Trichinella pseudospiralis]
MKVLVAFVAKENLEGIYSTTTEFLALKLSKTQ